MPDKPLDEAALATALAGRRVLVTGHTGFKGGWLCLWLKRLGVEVTGIALPPPPGPSLFDALGLADLIDHRIGDIRSAESFGAAVAGVDADLVIHMAAQALVRPSYQSPADTYLTNVVGTAVVLDAARQMPSLKAAVVVTSDKCYENNEWPWPYRETDAMGGADPYSASKGCAELVASSYRRSFFSAPGSALLATVRAGNVIGGGDWAVDRLIPDIIRAILAGTPVDIRNPASVRPWQHVLEPLSGYLTLAAKLLQPDGARFADGWNFGPNPDAFCNVETVARGLCTAWGNGTPELQLGKAPAGPHEAVMLTLDSSKAHQQLQWHPRLKSDQAIAMTAEWYRGFAGGDADLRALTENQIATYTGNDAPSFSSEGLKQCA